VTRATSRLRLAIVTPRFWPLAGEAQTHLLRLAEQFRLAGHTVTIVTAAWHRHWPRNIIVRELPVVRIKGAPSGGLGTLRYMYGLSNWLASERGSFDGVLVSTLRYEAYCAVRAVAGDRIPVVLQAEQAGPEGDMAWQQSANFGSRIASRCKQATAFVATSKLIAGELAAAGYDPTRTSVILRGVPIPPPHGATTRDAARESLATGNHDLAATTQQPVVVACGRFVPTSGFVELIKAWKSVAAKFPLAKLWVVGDGPLRERLYQLVGDLDLKQRVHLPGTFGEHDELLAAADLFVQPATGEVPTLVLSEALATGLPAIASDIAGHREWITDGETGVLVPPGDPKSLAAAMLGLLEQPARAVALGAEARERMRAEHSLTRCAVAYLELFERLQTGGRSSR
jgi:glycosyltransferase involved in cell wall biosynthesis